MHRTPNILVGLLIGALVFGHFAFATDGANGTSGPAMLDAITDQLFDSQDPPHYIEIPGAGQTLTLSGHSTSTITGLGTLYAGQGIRFGTTSTLTGTATGAGSVACVSSCTGTGSKTTTATGTLSASGTITGTTSRIFTSTTTGAGLFLTWTAIANSGTASGTSTIVVTATGTGSGTVTSSNDGSSTITGTTSGTATDSGSATATGTGSSTYTWTTFEVKTWTGTSTAYSQTHTSTATPTMTISGTGTFTRTVTTTETGTASSSWTATLTQTSTVTSADVTQNPIIYNTGEGSSDFRLAWSQSYNTLTDTTITADGDYTIGGSTWTMSNYAYASSVVVGSSVGGIKIVCQSEANSSDVNGNMTCPTLAARLTNLSSDLRQDYANEMWIMAQATYTSAPNTNYERNVVGLAFNLANSATPLTTSWRFRIWPSLYSTTYTGNGATFVGAITAPSATADPLVGAFPGGVATSYDVAAFHVVGRNYVQMYRGATSYGAFPTIWGKTWTYLGDATTVTSSTYSWTGADGEGRRASIYFSCCTQGSGGANDIVVPRAAIYMRN